MKSFTFTEFIPDGMYFAAVGVYNTYRQLCITIQTFSIYCIYRGADEKVLQMHSTNVSADVQKIK